jgi:pectate lyase
MGHLRVTWHHDWWADGVVERMPRVRYGQVHLYNNLYTSSGNSYCVGLGWNANLLLEDDVFIAVKNPINSTFDNGESVLMSFGNIYESGSLPTPNVGTTVFDPPYTYSLQPADAVQATVQANAGPSAK